MPSPQLAGWFGLALVHAGEGDPEHEWSFPSQAVAVAVHWQTIADWPSSAPHVHPATQSLEPVHVVEQTALAIAPEPLTGWQISLGQSEFFVQGVPVPLDGTFWQVPLRQESAPEQVLPAQQALPTASHDDAPSVPESPPPPLPEPLPLDVLAPELLPDELALDVEVPLDEDEEEDPEAPSGPASPPAALSLELEQAIPTAAAGIKTASPPANRFILKLKLPSFQSLLGAANVPAGTVGLAFAAGEAASRSGVATLARRALRVDRARAVRRALLGRRVAALVGQAISVRLAAGDAGAPLATLTCTAVRIRTARVRREARAVAAVLPDAALGVTCASAGPALLGRRVAALIGEAVRTSQAPGDAGVVLTNRSATVGGAVAIAAAVSVHAR